MLQPPQIPPNVTREQQLLTERMVLTATELGIGVVQGIAAQYLLVRPGTSLRDFTQILDQYLAKAKAAVARGDSINDI